MDCDPHRQEGHGQAVIGWRLAAEADWDAAQHQASAGRWHYAGARVIYASCTPELAVLEALAHHRPGDGPYLLCRVEGDPIASREVVDLRDLPADWRRRQAATRRLGSRWLAAESSTILEVPSAVCTCACNRLVNPVLAAPGRWRIEAQSPFRFDRRLVLRR